MGRSDPKGDPTTLEWIVFNVLHVVNWRLLSLSLRMLEFGERMATWVSRTFPEATVKHLLSDGFEFREGVLVPKVQPITKQDIERWSKDESLDLDP